MNLPAQFKLFLEKHSGFSSSTVKNYIADVNHFISWFEKNYNSKFDPNKVTLEDLTKFREEKGSSLSPASLNRHLSSLKKFFHFLKIQGTISQSPLEGTEGKIIHSNDAWRLKDFKNYLYVYNAAPLTIKNYIIDVKQFLSWLSEIHPLEASNNNLLLSKVNSELIEEYKTRMMANANFSPSSVNRKLSSLRRYFSWASEQGFIHSYIEPQVAKKVIKVPIKNAASIKTPEPKPTGAVGRIANIPLGIFDELITEPVAYLGKQINLSIWKFRGKPIFKYNQKDITPKLQLLKKPSLKIPNVKKEFYAPSKTFVNNLPIHRKFAFHIRHTRPNWYKKHQNAPLAVYFQYAVIIIIVGTLALGFYNAFVKKPLNQKGALAAPAAPPRILSFQGRLTDTSDNPITTTQYIRFQLYDDSAATDSGNLLWQEVDTVSPDTDGIFNVLLGNGSSCTGQPLTIQESPCAIDSTVFTDNQTLYLGVTIGTGDELTPRQQVATVAFASNSESLQGLLPTTDASLSEYTNTVLALDGTTSSPTLTIGGSVGATFEATGGEFVISGTPLLLTTTSGSNGNVALSPDGIGKIDLQKPLTNTTQTGNLSTAPGAVEVNDEFGVLATSSGRSAVTINQDSTGPVLSASISSKPVFTIGNPGGTVINGFNFTPSATGNGLSFTAIGDDSNIGLSITPKGTGALNLATTNTGNVSIGNGTGTIGLTLGSDAEGDIYYRNSGGTLSRLATSTDGSVLTVASGIPSWATSSGTGAVGYWTRTGTVLSPTNAGDSLTVTATATTGNVNTFADSSLAPAAAATGNLLNLTFTNGSTNSSGTSVVSGLNIAGTNTSSGSSGTMETYALRIQDIAGTAVNGTQNNYGIRIGNQGQSGAENSVGLYVDSQSGSATTNYSAIFAGGNVGIGDTSPQGLLTVGSSDAFQVDSSGNITTSGDLDINGTSNDIAGTLNLSGNTLTASGDLTINPSGGDTNITGTASISGTLTIGNGSTVKPAYGPLTLSYKSAADTWATGVTLQDTTGNVGIGDTSPASLFTVGNGDLFQVNSSGAIAAATGITSSGTINFSGLSASSFVGTDGSKNLTTSAGALASSALSSILSDETGSGVAVFGTSPEITTSLTTASTTFSLVNTTAATVNFAGGATTALNLGSSTANTVNVPSLTASSGVYTDSSKNLTSTPPTSGTLGFWQRNTTTIAPATQTDSILIGSGTGGTTSSYQLEVNGKITGKALSVFNETGDQSPLTASISGKPVFTVAHPAGTIINGFTLTPSATGNAVGVASSGDDTNIALTLNGKGSGTLTLQSAGTGNIQFFSSSNTIDSSGNLTIAGDATISGNDITNTTLNLGGGSAATLGTVSNDNLSIIPNGTGVLNLATTNTGNVSIGNGTGTVELTLGSDATGDIYYRSAGGVLARLAIGTGSECLIGGTTPSWGSCGGGPGTSNWNIGGDGVIYPINATLDLLLGASASSSAKFAVLNINSGTPTASISANTANNATYLTGDGTLSTTNRGTITIGSSSTYDTSGNILLAPNGTGSVGIGTTSPSNFKLQVAGDVGPNADDTYYLGSASYYWKGIYATDITVTNLHATSTDASGTTSDTFTLNSDNSTADTEDASYVIERGSSTPNIVLAWNSTTTGAYSKSITLNAPSFQIEPDTGITYSGKAALVVNQPQSQDLITASASGVTKFTVSNSGNITALGATLTGLTGSRALFTDGSSNIATSGNSSYLATSLGDETGTGYLVFNDQPTITNALNTTSSSFDLVNGTATTVNFAGGATTALSLGSSTASTVNVPSLTASRFVLTDSSKNLISSGASSVLSDTLSDETGSGVAVFGTSPAITTSLTTGSTSFDLLNTTATTINFGGGATTALGLGSSTASTVNVPSLTASRAVFTDSSKNLISSAASSVLLNSLTDATGTGVAVFGTSPAITTSLTTGSTSFSLVNTTATTVNFAGGATTALNLGSSTASTVNVPSLTASLGVYTDASKNLTSTPPTSGVLGYWSRSGTTLSPSNSGDAITTSGTISTTSSGTITSAGTLTASNGLTLTTGALSLTGTSGSIALTGFGTTSITSTTTTGNINTFADSSLAVAAAATGNLMNLTFTNASTNTSGTSIVTGLNIAGTLSASGTSGTHDTYGIRIQDLAGSPTGNGTQNTYGLRIGNQGITNAETTYGLYVDSQSGSATANYAAIFAGGNVGIGTTTPNSILDITEDQNAGSYVTITNSNSGSSAYAEFISYNDAGASAEFGIGSSAYAGGVSLYTNRAWVYSGSDSDGIVVGNGGADPIIFGVSDAEVARFSSTGLLGLGTNNPLTTLELGDQSNLQAATGGIGRFENYLIRSEDWSGAWTTTGLTISADNTTAPNGQATADKLLDATTAGTTASQAVTTNVGNSQVWTFSVWLKTGSHSGTYSIKLTDNGSGATTDTTTITASDATTWKRYSVSHTTAGSGTTSVTASIDVNASNNNTSYIYAWGAQLEKQSAPGVYFATGGSSSFLLTSPLYGMAINGGSLVIPDNGQSAGSRFLQIGDDTFLTDIDTANTLALYGMTDNTVANLKLGSDGPTLYGSSSNLGIGNSSPRATLDVTGSASISANLNFTNSSSANINSLNGGVLNIRNSPGGDAGLTTQWIFSAGGFYSSGCDSAYRFCTGDSQIILSDIGDGTGAGFRITDQSSIAYLQPGGGSSANSAAHMRINRWGTTTSNFDQFDVYADTTLLYGNVTIGNTEGQGITFVGDATWKINENNGCAGSDALCFKSGGTAEMSLTSGGSLHTRSSVQANDSTPDFGEGITAEDASVQPGDIVSSKKFDPNEPNILLKSIASKTATPYDISLIGAISAGPGIYTNANNAGKPNSVALTVAGRIALKVSSVNGTIATGDPITSSYTAGVGMKATKAGRIVGIAMEAYNNPDPNQIGQILVLNNPSWYDPDVYLTNSGNINIATSNPNNFVVQYQGGDITRIGTFAEVVVAKVRTGLIQAKQITTDSLNVATDSVTVAGKSLAQYISDIVDQKLANQQLTTSNQVKTNTIEPKDTNKLAVKLKDNQGNSKLEIQNASGTAVFDVDSLGNATTSGSLRADSIIAKQLTLEHGLSVLGDATVSGTLRAQKIIADQIEGLSINSASISATYITNVNNYYGASESASASPSGELIATGSANFISGSAIFENGIMAFGPSALSDLTLTGQLSVGSQLTLADSSINVLGGDLQIQPLRQGGVSFESGLVAIDSEGNLSVNGNATFARDVSIQGILTANQIAPFYNGDLVINLAAPNQASSSSKLVVKNASGSAILALDQTGNLTASGAATFAKLNLDASVASASSSTQAIATGSAGFAVIKQGQIRITINNPIVTDKSLIYVTPKANTTYSGVPYIEQQADGQSFTVRVSQPAPIDIPFNWILIN